MCCKNNSCFTVRLFVNYKYSRNLCLVYFNVCWKWTRYLVTQFLVGSFPIPIGIFSSNLTFPFFIATFTLLHILSKKGWYIITYALGIYHLNLFIAFLSPKIDPAMSDFEESEDGGPELPTKVNEEFRPFIRRLPEFKFWYSVSKSTVIAVICTFFEVFNIPVFWPILVMYFITLFCLTMKRQIKHMIKYRYIPFTHGKPKFDNGNKLVGQ
nr:EOG090X0FVI [Eubosmina coregoni]